MRTIVPNGLFLLLFGLIGSISPEAAFAGGTGPVVNEVMAANLSTLRDEDGDYSDWLEIYNLGPEAVDLNGYGLSDDPDEPFKWTFPALHLPSGRHLLVFASGKDRKLAHVSVLHANFKIKACGEPLLLTSSSGTRCDSLHTAHQPLDVSQGRQPDGANRWVFFDEPTPGEPNAGGFPAFAESVAVSLANGFYAGSVSVTLSSSPPAAEIRYTLDGSDPKDGSLRYSAPLRLAETRVLKARFFAPGLLPGPVATRTYLIDERITLPVVSLSTDPAHLFDDDTGIYVEGNSTTKGGYPGSPVGPPANYWEDWERPVHLEFLLPNGRTGFAVEAGVKMFGKTSRRLPQKSFALFARDKYGFPAIDYPLFPGLPITSFKSILLRNAGSDNTYNEGAVHFRDGLAATLAGPLDLEKQAHRPSVLFVNGEYWGIYNIREKVNEDFLVAHHRGVDPDSVDILDDYHTLYPLVVEGDAEHYDALIDFLQTHSLDDAQNAARVQTRIDVDNYLDYMAAQIYFANQDGPGHNSKFWRPRSPEGRYRWLLYDTDHSFGLLLFVPTLGFAPEAYRNNTLAYYREAHGPGWPNPPESTFLFRKVLENSGFRNDFVNSLADHLNTVFAAEIAGRKLETMVEALEPEMPRHLGRWGGEMDRWRRNVEVVRQFASRRDGYLRDHVVDEFDLGGTAEIELDISPPGGGRIGINSLEIAAFPWRGTYFRDIPVRLTALPDPGYRFAAWRDLTPADSASLQLGLSGDLALTALFAADDPPDGSVVINEINYHSADEFDPRDWVELHNPADRPRDLSGWTFQDDEEDHRFILPEGSVIPSSGYLVLCRDASAFRRSFPAVDRHVGDFSFGLSSAGESIRLLDDREQVADSLTYRSDSPWPSAPDGTGPTLALRHPGLDNALAESWAASAGYGTPGVANRLSTAVERLQTDLPVAFALGRNYPNPFNYSTMIPFSVPRTRRVVLEIFAVDGQRVQTLVDGNLTAGRHAVTWNAAGLASGVYICRLSAGEFVGVGKLLLAK